MRTVFVAGSILAASLCLVIGAVLMASRCRALTEGYEEVQADTYPELLAAWGRLS